MKLALGTVQFGIQYGISNKSGIPNEESLKAIFETCRLHQINTFDTAIAYGNAEERIGLLLQQSAEVVSKFPKIEQVEEVGNYLNDSLKRLNRSCLEGFIAHNADFLIDKPEVWKSLQVLKKLGKVKKIGFSLYSPQQLEQLLAMDIIPDLVQLPYSIFDRKFEPFFKLLKDKQVEIHIRSVFLQGLYFLDSNALPEKLLPLKDNLDQLQNICKSRSLNVNDVCLNFVNDNPLIDKIVIGVENTTQLLENINSIQNWNSNVEIWDSIRAIEIKNLELLNPVNW